MRPPDPERKTTMKARRIYPKTLDYILGDLDRSHVITIYRSRGQMGVRRRGGRAFWSCRLAPPDSLSQAIDEWRRLVTLPRQDHQDHQACYCQPPIRRKDQQ